ncbi:ATP-binding protein [bacterium]|nr:ATP-binding protein [candidate division CSSED10-310 bacterium]
MSTLPAWAEEMRQAFRAETTSQFILHGNVNDLFPVAEGGAACSFLSLRAYLTDVMFGGFDVVIQYDRGKGLKVARGSVYFETFMKIVRTYRADILAQVAAGGAPDGELNLVLPADPKRALSLVDRFIRMSITAPRAFRPDQEGRLRIAVIIDYAAFVAPHADPVYMSGDLSEVVLKLLDWARDPAVTSAYIATCLITENLLDLNQNLVENPYAAKIMLPLPDEAEIRRFIDSLTRDVSDFSTICEVDRRTLAQRLVGLSRINVSHLIRLAWKNGRVITGAYLTDRKKELIEKEVFGRLEFVESPFTLDAVAGHEEAIAWLRRDAELFRRGKAGALPMGYLICGRIGTGKTFLVECFAGEVGVPVVELKNFREKWVGATESNLERIFNILHALGQVVVFVDEADQVTGKRGGSEGDSGLSGRIYSMLAREMSDTKNRGRILWIFATSRPDLLEVDLKRQGRLDIHIPLFPPQNAESRRQLLAAMVRKLKLKVNPADLPELPENAEIGGNEMEGMLIRANRLYETRSDPNQGFAELLAATAREFRPSAHVERLRLMDLLAVKECTDERFLPERYKGMSLADLNTAIQEMKARLGEM